MLSSLASLVSSKPAPGSLYDELTAKKPRDPNKPRKPKRVDVVKQQMRDIDDEARKRLSEAQAQSPADSEDEVQQIQPKSARKSRKSKKQPANPVEAVLLEATRAQVVDEMAAATVKAHRGKLQAQSNAIRNTLKHEASKADDYSMAREEAKLKRHIANQYMRRSSITAPVKAELDKPEPVIHGALLKCAESVVAAETFLLHEGSIQAMLSLDWSSIRASIECWCSPRTAHALNYKYECVWRLAFVCERWPYTPNQRNNASLSKEFMTRLAQICYRACFDVCDPDRHPAQYHALAAALRQAQDDINQFDMIKAFAKFNSPMDFGRTER